MFKRRSAVLKKTARVNFYANKDAYYLIIRYLIIFGTMMFIEDIKLFVYEYV